MIKMEIMRKIVNGQTERDNDQRDIDKQSVIDIKRAIQIHVIR